MALRACFVLLAALAGALGCGTDGPQRFDRPTEPIQVEPGESFEIALGADSTTGYEWQLSELPSGIVRYDGSDYIPDPGSEGEDGGGGDQILSFTALRRGEATLDLEYVFSGGEDRDPDDQISVEVDVR